VSEHDAKRLEYGDSSPLFIPEAGFNAENVAVSDETQGRVEPAHSNNLHFQSLDAFRPIVGRAPEPPVAEAQRREFFAQLHRWLRQGYAVHVFCNNEGERQRFTEIWEEYGIGTNKEGRRDACATMYLGEEGRRDACPTMHLGALTRGFLCEPAKL